MTNLTDAIAKRYDNPAALFRSLYKHTDCGAQAGLLVDEVSHAGGTRWVYDARDLPRSWEDIHVLAVSVWSAVEGIDATTETHIVYAKDVTDEDFYETLDAAVAAVEAEAAALWNETHGCPTCAAHHGVDLTVDYATVWGECPDCGGRGHAF